MWMCILALVGLQLDPAMKTEVLKALEHLDSISMGFVQETYSPFFEPTRSAGTLWIQRPGRMRMEYDQGESKWVVCDGRHYVEVDRMAEITSAVDLMEIRDEPLVRVFLLGDRLDEHFLVDRYQDPEFGDTFRFRSRQPSEYSLEMRFDARWQLVFLNIESSEGEGSMFWFSRHQPLEPRADLFKLPADVELNPGTADPGKPGEPPEPGEPQNIEPQRDEPQK